MLNCNKINYSWSIDKSNLIVAPYYTLVNTKWRNQQLNATLYIPNGTSIKLHEGLSNYIKDLNEDQVYTMKNGKLE